MSEKLYATTQVRCPDCGALITYEVFQDDDDERAFEAYAVAEVPDQIGRYPDTSLCDGSLLEIIAIDQVTS